MGIPTDVLERSRRIIVQRFPAISTGPTYIRILERPTGTNENANAADKKRIVSVVVAVAILLSLLFSTYLLHPERQNRSEATLENRNFAMFNLLGDFDASGIRHMCEHKRFEKGLYFRCEEHDGGFGNVKNSILLCTRYAIQLGGHLVYPKIHLRSAANLAELDGERRNMSYMFDEELYAQRVQNSCPGMKVYRSVEEIPEVSSLAILPTKFDPLDMHPHEWLMNKNLATLRTDFRKWLQGQHESAISPDKPILIDLKRTLFGWKNDEDTFEVWTQWSKLLQFNPEIYNAAADVLSLLAGTSAKSMYKPMPMLEDFRYVGQHLRTEADSSVEMQVFGFEPQLGAALRTCQEEQILDLYIASGDASEGEKAAVRGAELGINVHTKYTLMTKNHRLKQTIEGMTFDQQALIDFLILSKATKFVGVDSSSFSAQLAVTRHVYLNNSTFWKDFSDDLSFLVGNRYPWLRNAIWP